MASTLVALQTVTVGGAGAASILFSSIPQTYNDLVVKVSARTTTGGVDAGTYLYFNGTVVGTARKLGGNGSVAFSDTGANIIDQGNGATANTFGNFEAYIPNYTNYGLKSVSLDGVNETNATTVYMNLMALISTNVDAGLNPVLTLGFTPVSGTFMQYSTFTLYGVYKSPLDTAVEAPTIGTATAASTGANVAFTPSGTGAPATSYVATSSPGGITATGTTSPILVTGLTSGTSYTFTVKGQNPGGTGAASAASNSVTPYDGYESIATAYPTGSTASFTSIPSGYTHLQLRVFGKTDRPTYAQDGFKIVFNSDTGSNYSRHGLGGDSSSAFAYGTSSTTDLYVYDCLGTTVNNNVGGAVVDILDYSNTNKYTTTRSLGGVSSNTSAGGLYGAIILSSGLWQNTAAVSSITLTPHVGPNFVSGTTFELFGIRG